MKTSSIRHMLVADLEGAVLGHADSLEGFRQWATEERAYMTVVYFTRRAIPNPRQYVEHLSLPTPDFLIAALASEIFDFALDERVAKWERLTEVGWDAELVRRTIQSIGGMNVRFGERLSPHMVSVLLEDRSATTRSLLENALSREGMLVQTNRNGDFLEIVPGSTDQLAALQFLARQLRIPLPQVIACGGDESNSAVFYGSFSGVLVANSSIHVPTSLTSLNYRSPFAFADGIIDGVQFWREKWASCAPGR